MERNYNQLKKEQYAMDLARAGELDRAKEIMLQDDYLPILRPVELHAETEISEDDVNLILNDIGTDISIINTDLTITAEKFSDLLKDTREELNSIKKILRTEKERQEDINILCNKYSNFSNVILISDKNTTGNMNYYKDTFSSTIAKSTDIKGEIVEIVGNGYEGNQYVYKNKDFVSNVSDTSKRDYIMDNSLLTYYEYSRITANNTEPDIFPLVNFDSIMARCSILIKAEDTINSLELTTDNDDVILESLSTSLDGNNYLMSDLKDVAICNKKSRFENKDYVYGSGLLAFRDCRFVKLVLRANKNSTDTISFVKTRTDNTETPIILDTAKRSVIKINDITLKRTIYNKTGQLRFDNFITDPVKSIAIFANEYVPDDVNLRASITYTLNVNGISYDVIPINSQYNGKKIIRTTNHSVPAEHVHYINESIKHASLTVNVKGSNNYLSPFISDLKILIGGE